MQHLSDLRERTEDPLKTERIRNVLHDVSMRVQDLRPMEAVYIEFFVSIEMTRQNNNRLGQSVERTLALGTNVVLIGLATQMALSRQKRVLEATRRDPGVPGQPYSGQRCLSAASRSGNWRRIQQPGDCHREDT